MRNKRKRRTERKGEKKKRIHLRGEPATRYVLQHLDFAALIKKKFKFQNAENILNKKKKKRTFRPSYFYNLVKHKINKILQNFHKMNIVKSYNRNERNSYRKKHIEAKWIRFV
jgi:hypothetical protein